MVIQVVIRMTLYLDQAIIRNQQTFANESIHYGIQNTVINCPRPDVMVIKLHSYYR